MTEIDDMTREAVASTGTTILSEAILAEHRGYRRRLDELQRLADDCGDEKLAATIDDLDRTLAFLEDELLPHASAEDAVLYVAVERARGVDDGTEMMRRDHEEIRRLVQQLRALRDDLANPMLPAAWCDVRATLYALHAIVQLHVAKEEELFLPLLERSLDDGEAKRVLFAMRDLVHHQHVVETATSHQGP